MTAPERPGPERPGPDYPAEWDTEPDDADDLWAAYLDDQHDTAHPAWVEGCDACIQRADHIETIRP